MALTATASKATRSNINQMLLLRNPILVYAPPVKHNIVYFVKYRNDTSMANLIKGLD